MKSVEWNVDQEKAISLKNCNLLVAAAAGSGKTAVLVERIRRNVIENKGDIDRYLIVTFTNAAAAEMKAKIIRTLEEAAEEAPENDHLKRQMLLAQNATITTIDSFCLKVLRDNFQKVEIDPEFRIADQTELALLQAEVIDGCFKKWHREKDPAFKRLLDSYSSVKDDSKIKELIIKLNTFASSKPWPKKWLNSLCFREETDNVDEDKIVHLVMEKSRKTLKAIEETIKVLVDTAVSEMCPYEDALRSDLAIVRELLEKSGKGYFELQTGLKNITYDKLKTIRADKKTIITEAIKDTRNQIKKQIGELLDKYFIWDRDELPATMNKNAEVTAELVKLTCEFYDAFLEQKKEKNILNFSDIEQYALNILVNEDLTPTETALEMASGIDEIMIDEYQDSNDLQELILTSVSKGKGIDNVFMVGDVKQSIYKFRMVSPDLFSEKYGKYSYSEGTKRKVDLHANYRSRIEVLDTVNCLFADTMNSEVAEIDYDEAAMLNCAGKFETNEKNHDTELLLIMNDKEKDNEVGVNDGADEKEPFDDTSDADEEDLETIGLEATAVASRIKELVCERKEYTYKDIVILIRSSKGFSETFLRIFAENGIPAYSETEKGYFSAVEVRKTIALLQIIDNPYQDIPFAAVLFSDIAGLSADDIGRLRAGRKKDREKNKISLYRSARIAAGKEKNESDGETDTFADADASLKGKLCKFFRIYDELRKAAEYESIHELIEHFYRISDFYDMAYVMPGGRKRRGNLDMLVTLAKKYENTGFCTLTEFVRYINRLNSYEQDMGEAKESISGDMVRIMTMHKSKGLEFPVVFVCGLSKKINFSDTTDKIVFHEKYGIGASIVDPKTHVKQKSMEREFISSKIADEAIAEEMRILYVALTRAKEKLFLSGVTTSKKLDSWRKQMPFEGMKETIPFHILKAKSYFDFICPEIFTKACPEFTDIEDEIMLERQIGTRKSRANIIIRKVDGNMLFSFKVNENNKIAANLDEMLKKIANLSYGKRAMELEKLLKEERMYRYLYEKEAALPVKVTVSDIKRMFIEENAEESAAEDDAQTLTETLHKGENTDNQELIGDRTVTGASQNKKRPYIRSMFSKDSKLSPAERGTVYHHVMENIDFSVNYDKESLHKELERLLSIGILSKEQFEAIREIKIMAFLKTELAKRMQRAAKTGKLFREQPFVIALPAKEIDMQYESEEPILVQGVIDVYFEEEEKLVIMDYKTDHVGEDVENELKKKYKKQLELYKLALEQVTGKKVGECIIYSFAAETEIRV